MISNMSHEFKVLHPINLSFEQKHFVNLVYRDAVVYYGDARFIVPIYEYVSFNIRVCLFAPVNHNFYEVEEI